MAQLMAAPLREKERIMIIDSIRGVALLGILMMNIPGFANPEEYSNLNTFNQYSGRNFYTWWIVEGFFEGTMRALFSMLFGAGCILLINRLEKRGTKAADIYHRRLLWLFLFGLINAFIFQWWGDILYFYAICGLFLFPFRNMKAKHLLMFALAFFLFYSIKNTHRMYKMDEMRTKGMQAVALEKQKKTLTDDQKAAKEKWTAYQESSKPESLQKAGAKNVAEMRKGYFHTLGFNATKVVQMESTYFYHFIFFDIMCLLFLGMALFKWGVLTGARSKKFYWIMLALSYPIGIALSYWEHSQMVAARFDHTQMLSRLHVDFYEFRRTFLALGHLSVLMLLYKYGLVKWFFNAMAKVGQMAFSNYLMQSVICAVIFFGFGFGMYGKLQIYQQYYVVFCIWIFQIIFSSLWLHYYRFGPFEWAWRSLTYWKKQQMKKTASVAEESNEDAGTDVAPQLA